MGLFDKIKDNAKTISMKAIESTREYDEDYIAQQQAAEAAVNAPAVVEQSPPEVTEEPKETEVKPTEETKAEDAPEEKPAKKETEKPTEKSSDDTKSTVRKSKVVEISKEEYEQSKRQKKQAEEQEKTKQAAKERLAKEYKPSYKADKTPAKTTTVKKPNSRTITVGFADVTPGKIVDPTKAAIYARERAALSALASRRKLDGSVPLYVASHMNFKTRVFIDRIEYSGSFGKTSLPVDQVAWVKLRSSGTGVIIETTEGKRFVMVVKPSDRLEFAAAVLKVQSIQPKRSKFKDTKTVRIDELDKFSEGVDEIEKLAKLYDKGILSQEEFDKKKKQILGI